MLLPQTMNNHVISPAWTLTYEVVFYLSFSAFFLLPRRFFLPVLGTWFLINLTVTFGFQPTRFYQRFFWGPVFLNIFLGCFAAFAIRKGVTAGARTCVVCGVLWYATGAILHYAGVVSALTDYGHRFLVFGCPAGLLVYGLASWNDPARACPRAGFVSSATPPAPST